MSCNFSPRLAQFRALRSSPPRTFCLGTNLKTISFQDLALIEPLQRALRDQSYLHPTPIQGAAIPPLLAGRDLLGCAETGTGKTAAFALPILQHLDQNRAAAVSRSPKVLVLAPTRELANQIGHSFKTYGQHLHFRQLVVFGGVNQNPQTRALLRGVHVLIATPGRLLDLMNQGYVRFHELRTFVLDEADRMLDMGFLPDLRRIVAQLPPSRQSLFFSATMPSEAAALAQALLTDPVRIRVESSQESKGALQQSVIHVDRAAKRSLLNRMLGEIAYDRVLVFTRTKHGADKLARQLTQTGRVADAIHGNKSQNARERTLEQFRKGSVRVLVATDVAGRGIDVQGISHVINFDLPNEPESYVHRIGRTARAGANGVAISFCDPAERPSLKAIEKLIQRKIQIAGDHPNSLESTKPPAQSLRPPRGRPFSRAAKPRRLTGKP
jgi:ATP-dependent RNA helicase RhlE